MRFGKSISPGCFYVKLGKRCWFVCFPGRYIVRWYGETPWGEHLGGNGPYPPNVNVLR